MMPQTSGRILSLYYQVCRVGSREGIEAVYSEKDPLHCDERILANSYHKRRHRTLRMFPVLRLSSLPLLSPQRR